MIKTGLTEEELERSALLLNGLLADHFTLMLKTWQFHWNVVGTAFGSYHEAMKGLYESEIERVDSIAERIRSLGKRPLGSMEAILQANHIQEFKMNEQVPEGIDMWRIISNEWDRVIQFIRDIHGQIPKNDLATLNFLEDMIDSMEKEAWMIRSYNSVPGID